MKGWILADQLMTVDRRSILREPGKLSAREIERLRKVIRETYAD